jgi:outer membrane immunogenic protein
MYRRVLLCAVTSVALVSSAFAADIYMPSAPYAVVALPPSWGGFYAGVNGGYGGNNSLPFSQDVFFPGTPPSYTVMAGVPVIAREKIAFTNPYSVLNGTDTIAGGFGGGQIGYNFQFGSWVLGAEADLQGAGIRGSGSQSIINPLGVTTGPLAITGGTAGPTGVCQTTSAASGSLLAYPGGVPGGACVGRNDLDVDWFGTVRARLGYAFGNTLIYGTGGFAAGGVTMSSTYTDNNVALGGAKALAAAQPNVVGDLLHPQVARVSNSATNTGWTAGGGIEVKLSPSWSLKGEYQYINLGTISAGPGEITIPTSQTNNVSPCAKGGSDCLNLTGSKDVAFNTVRVGLNYYFNAPPPPLPLK